MLKGNRKSNGSKNGSIPSKMVPAFFKNLSFQRWLIAFGLCLMLTYFLSPQINFGVPEYKAGAIAIKDIKADRDFLVEDKTSTEQRKTEANPFEAFK